MMESILTPLNKPLRQLAPLPATSPYQERQSNEEITLLMPRDLSLLIRRVDSAKGRGREVCRSKVITDPLTTQILALPNEYKPSKEKTIAMNSETPYSKKTILKPKSSSARYQLDRIDFKRLR